MATYEADAGPIVVTDPNERTAAKISRAVAKTPLHIFLAFVIFLLRNFFIGIPKDILESARIDGASEIRIFLRLILPLGLPAIASLAIFQFLWTWNDLIVSLTFNVQPITYWIFGQL